MAKGIGTTLLSGETKAVNGVYKFELYTLRMAGIGAGIIFVLGAGMASTAKDAFNPIMFLGVGVGIALASIAALTHLWKLSGRTLQLSDDGISIRDKYWSEFESIHWIELGKVTERRNMDQLALWDKSGARRVLIDGQYKNFELIRSRVLDEYAKVRVQPRFPMKFSGSGVFCYETFVYLAAALGIGFGGWRALHDGAYVVSGGLFCVATFFLVSLLDLHPEFQGPSILFADHLVLRSFFKTREIYKRDVASVRIDDVANPKSGSKFSLIVIQLTNGKQIKINARYGSIPEIYLSLKTWLAEK